MRKRFLFFAAGALTAIGLAAWLAFHYFESNEGFTLTDTDRAEAARNLGVREPPQPPPPAPIDVNQPIRLAIGGLGLGDDGQNRRVGDLIVANLTGAQGLDLVERQELDAVLRELRLSLSGLVRARDAVRAGKLLRADWFLLGTAGKINGADSVVVRVVDARTGILRDAAAIAADAGTPRLATALAGFIRQCRERAAETRPPMYLAIGTFEDLSLNSRLASFPGQLRSYLTANLGGAVTLVERDCVNALLRETRLDMAGLTDESDGASSAPMQSAFWLVQGYCQSAGEAATEVELVLEISRMFGRRSVSQLQGPPDEVLFHQARTAISNTLQLNRSALVVSRLSETLAQLTTARELIRSDPNWRLPNFEYAKLSSQAQARSRRNAEEIIRSLETVLLLDPTNSEAKVNLALGLQKPFIGRQEEARNYCREMLEGEVQGQWTAYARSVLLQSFEGTGFSGIADWFDSAAGQTVNAATAAYYRSRAEHFRQRASERNPAVTSANSAGEKSIESGLVAALEKWKSETQRDVSRGIHTEAIGSFVKSYGTNSPAAAKRLAELLPELKPLASGCYPDLLVSVLLYQVDTNSPVIGEFSKSLDDWVENPGEAFNIQLRPDHLARVQAFWDHFAFLVYEWSAEHGSYRLAGSFLEHKARSAEKGHAAPLSDMETVALAGSYRGEERWKEAAEAFGSLSNRPVRIDRRGLNGWVSRLVLTSRETADCREKAGLPVLRDPREFKLNSECVYSEGSSAFTTDDDGIWIARGGRLQRLDLDLKTNLTVTLPAEVRAPVTSICRSPSSVWIGTEEGGLIEYEKDSGRWQILRESDGLLSDFVTQLQFSDGFLWIGYPAGLGRFDPSTRRLTSLIPAFDPGADRNQDPPTGPPRGQIQAIWRGAPGELWLWVARKGMQRHRIVDQAWETLPWPNDVTLTCFAANATSVIGGVSEDWQDIKNWMAVKPKNGSDKDTLFVDTPSEAALLKKKIGDADIRGITRVFRTQLKGGLVSWSADERKWQNLMAPGELPNPPTTLTLNGQGLWVAGEGFIALVDVGQRQIRRLCYVDAHSIDLIQLGGGYVWVKFGGHLHRARLKETL